jgi:hypothetical protein
MSPRVGIFIARHVAVRCVRACVCINVSYCACVWLLHNNCNNRARAVIIAVVRKRAINCVCSCARVRSRVPVCMSANFPRVRLIWRVYVRHR